MKRTTFFLLLVLSGTFCSQARAQKVAIKTNVLYDAFLNVNVGVEVGLAPRWAQSETLGDCVKILIFAS